ncbi:aminoacyltransferase [Arthrobacter sp. MYb227]|uniref:lipid II:glycine glycyltransferase FemX n=1 Tax=Arthrobacter sp. MYb227 TaxID=1848601 RepID=UPI002157D676|nr:aminoacyltransferase [Arthrobacter sp. MYb227]
MPQNQLSLRPITQSEHSSFLQGLPGVSFLQRPEWAKVKGGWGSESLGWFQKEELVGAALVLHRAAPVIGHTLAYLPDGPVINWENHSTKDVLAPMIAHFRKRKVFLVRMSPGLMRNTWSANDARKALSGGEHQLIPELAVAQHGTQAEALAAELAAAGWTKQEVSEDFAAGQPEFVARIPLIDAQGQQRDLDGVLAQFASTARNETRKGARGPLEIQVGTAADMERFHALYRETADRNEFSGRPSSYFTTMITELNAAVPGSCTLYFAVHEGRDLASAIRVRSGNLAWYVYGASSSAERKLFAPKALVHRMITDSIDEGCIYLDQGGVSATLDKAHHLSGLTHFKTSMGCDIVQTLGEWDLPLNKPLAWGFNKYMARRERG